MLKFASYLQFTYIALIEELRGDDFLTISETNESKHSSQFTKSLKISISMLFLLVELF
jgi:hypothetical protein